MAKHELQREIRDEQGIRFALAWAESLIRQGLRAGPVLLSLGRPRRSLDQNAHLWAVLTDVARQVEWHGQRLTKENWKDIFTAALKRQQVVPGLDGGFVVLGTSTSRMSKREFSDLLELVFAFGAERGVEWSKQAQDVFGEQRRVA
jgi:hypothetical protein